MRLYLLLGLPAAAGVITFFVRRVRFQLTALLASAVLHAGLTASLWLSAGDLSSGSFLGVDAPGLLFLSLTSIVFFAVSFYSIQYLSRGTHDAPSGLYRFVPNLLWFLSAMTLVTVSRNMALMWAAIEATTLASAPLIYFYRRRSALEAAWKYLLICSVGIAVALLGTFFLGVAASASPADSPGLSLTALINAGPRLPRLWVDVAFLLALVGYGTKMGLAPLHTWLPDAHSQAPSPVSALLSGALLNCAFLGILRFYQVCVAAGEGTFARSMLLVMGFVSIGVAAAFLVGQKDYKRLLAYSSVENMGIIAIGIGLGGSAIYGAMLHAVNHSLCKAGLFMLAGNVLHAFGTTSAQNVRGLARHSPMTGTMLVVAFLAIGGTPPFGPFVSEFTIFSATIRGGQLWLGALFLALLAVASLGMAGVILPMAQGTPANAVSPPRKEATLSIAPPFVLIVVILILGMYVPAALDDLLSRTAMLLGG